MPETSYSPAVTLRPCSHHLRHRRGAVLLAVMVCIFVSIAMVAAAISSSTTARRESKMALFRQQAVLLLDFGIDRLSATLDAAEVEPFPLSSSKLSSLDMTPALKDYELAQIEYTLVDDWTEPTPDTSAQATVRIRCTARLSRHSSTQPEFTLSREVLLAGLLHSNNNTHIDGE
jgi:hypothetical protein